MRISLWKTKSPAKFFFRLHSWRTNTTQKAWSNNINKTFFQFSFHLQSWRKVTIPKAWSNNGDQSWSFPVTSIVKGRLRIWRLGVMTVTEVGVLLSPPQLKWQLLPWRLGAITRTKAGVLLTPPQLKWQLLPWRLGAITVKKAGVLLSPPQLKFKKIILFFRQLKWETNLAELILPQISPGMLIFLGLQPTSVYT